MHRLIPITEVIIPEGRQRREFSEDGNQALMSSIQSIGLLQAPVLELIGQEYVLRAGERRYRAIVDLYALNSSFSYDGTPIPLGQFPHTLWTDLTDLQRLEIEVQENNCRVAFSWQERAEATAKLARLRALQAEQDGTVAPTVADLSVEVRGSKIGSLHTATRNDLILAQYLDRPEVAQAKTAKEAMLVLKRVEQAERHRRLAREFRGVVQGRNYDCVKADAQEWCAGQPGGVFEAICTDPPYGIGANRFGECGKADMGPHGYADSPEVVERILEWFPSESYRLAKPQAHAYVFLDIEWFPLWKREMAAAGWRVFRTPLVWLRPAGFRAPWPQHGPQRKYECLLYAVKGDKPVNFIAPDVISTSGGGVGLGHPAAKPVSVYVELLRRSVKPGDTVFDPFCGTGPIFGAAKALSCRAVGVEIDETFYGIALGQLATGEGR
jgi:hypothetical protein